MNGLDHPPVYNAPNPEMLVPPSRVHWLWCVLLPLAQVAQASDWRRPQTQLAEKIGANQGHVSRWERSLAEPPVTMLERIAFALDLSVGAILVDGKPKLPKWD